MARPTEGTSPLRSGHTAQEVAKYGTHVLREPQKGVVVVSFPRSGRTWLRVLLDRLGLHLAYTHDQSGHQKRLSRSEISEDKSAFAEHKVILLIRDPRDVVVSGYFLARHRHGLFTGTLSEFLRDEHHGLRKVLHFNQTWYSCRNELRGFLLVRYESMHEDLLSEAQRILRFVGHQATESAVREAISFCRFGNMQRLEGQGYFEEEYGVLLSSQGADPRAFKTRRGEIGGYQRALSPGDRAYCEQVLRDCGYPLLEEALEKE